MDFLERIFSLSPDGGSGATEVLLLGAMVCAVVVAFARPFHAHWIRGALKARSHAE